jgi:hypothetical protein
MYGDLFFSSHKHKSVGAFKHKGSHTQASTHKVSHLRGGTCGRWLPRLSLLVSVGIAKRVIDSC